MNILSLKKPLDIRLTVEQISYIEISLKNEVERLRERAKKARDDNDSTVNIKEIENRINVMTRTRRRFLESLDD